MPKKHIADKGVRHIYTDQQETRAIENNGEKYIEGYAAVFDVPTTIDMGYWQFREYVRKTAFNKTLADKADVAGLRNHDVNFLWARSNKEADNLVLKTDSKGLYYSGKVINDTGMKVWEDVRDGLITGNSFGFRVMKDSWSEEEENLEDGSSIMLDVRELLEVKLFDISPVTFPQYDETAISARDIFGNTEIDTMTGLMRYLMHRSNGLPITESLTAELPKIQEELRSILAGLEPQAGHSNHPTEPGLSTQLDQRARYLALREAEIKIRSKVNV